MTRKKSKISVTNNTKLSNNVKSNNKFGALLDDSDEDNHSNNSEKNINTPNIDNSEDNISLHDSNNILSDNKSDDENNISLYDEDFSTVILNNANNNTNDVNCEDNDGFREVKKRKKNKQNVYANKKDDEITINRYVKNNIDNKKYHVSQEKSYKQKYSHNNDSAHDSGIINNNRQNLNKTYLTKNNNENRHFIENKISNIEIRSNSNDDNNVSIHDSNNLKYDNNNDDDDILFTNITKNVTEKLYKPPVSTIQFSKNDSESNKHLNSNYELPPFEQYDPTKKNKGDDMKLNSSWTVWIHENENNNWTLDSYTSIYKIDSVGSMWRFLSVFDNLDKSSKQYYIMRNGITPIWEDNNNRTGGICSILIENTTKYSKYGSKSDICVSAFIAICILVMNESFVKNNLDINGLCYSIKSKSALIKLWVKNYDRNQEFLSTLPVSIFRTLENILLSIDTKHKSNDSISRISLQMKQITPNY